VLANQQVIAEVPAQPGQRGARRGLGHAEPLRRARDATLPDQFPQRDEQVQVEISQVSDGARHGALIQRPPAAGWQYCARAVVRIA